MADFCKQCSLEYWGQDNKDLAFLGGLAPTILPTYGYWVICEGCGQILVDDYGNCVTHGCLKKHGGEQKCQVSNTCT